MGSGSLIQLVAVGPQDVPLIGNPQMTHFKSVFKRHTNFALESIPLNFNQALNFDRKSTCLIDKKGDLLSDIWLEVKLPALSTGISWANGIGYTMINKVELEIGGYVIDTLYGNYMDINGELTTDESHMKGYYKTIGKHNTYTKYSQDTNIMTLYIHLPFWFTNNYGLALPMVALQYHDVVLNVYIKPFSKLWYSGTSMSNIPSTPEITNAFVYCDYIFLDSKERRIFAQNNHTYLITQHQISDGNPVLAGQTLSKADINFNLPVKELKWIYQAHDVQDTNDWTNYSNTLDNDQIITKQTEAISTVALQVNGHDRFSSREGSYFRLVQPIKYHTRTPDDFIYTYSFALYPEKAQPSGSIDFSWLNSAVMTFEHPTNVLNGNITIFAINYNYLQISKGQANLVYQS